MKRILPLLFLVSLAIHAAADPLSDGIKTVSTYKYGVDRTNIVAFDTYIRTGFSSHVRSRSQRVRIRDW